MKNIALIAAFLILLVACEEEESNPTGGLGEAKNVISGSVGSSFDVTLPDGSKEKMSGDRVSGWTLGMLLGGNYFKHIRIFNEGHTMDFRLSVPKDTSFMDIVERQHELRAPFLRLEYTGDLEDVYPVLYIGYSKDDKYDSDVMLTGSVEIKRDVSVLDKTYELVGIVNASYREIKFDGYFWMEEADW